MHFGKRLWNDEPVPTLHSPAARILHVHRDDWGSGFLCEKNNPGSEFVSRTARAIRGEKNVATGSEDFAQLEQRARAQSRARPANDIKSKTPRDIGNEIAVPAGADQTCAGALGKKLFQDE